MKKKAFLLAVGAPVLSVISSASALAEGESLIPDLGIDIATYATEASTAMSPAIKVCIGITVAITLVCWGLRWFKQAGKPQAR